MFFQEDGILKTALVLPVQTQTCFCCVTLRNERRFTPQRFLLCECNLVVIFYFLSLFTTHYSLSQSLVSPCRICGRSWTHTNFRKNHTWSMHAEGIPESASAFYLFLFQSAIKKCCSRGRGLVMLGVSPAVTLRAAVAILMVLWCWREVSALGTAEPPHRCLKSRLKFSLHFIAHEFCSWLPVPPSRLPKVSALCPLGALYCFSLKVFGLLLLFFFSLFLSFFSVKSRIDFFFPPPPCVLWRKRFMTFLHQEI